MSETPITIVNALDGGYAEVRMLQAAQEKCRRMLVGWRARVGAEEDVAVQRSYTFPGYRIDIDSTTSTEAVTVRTTDEGARREYQLISDGTLVIPNSDLDSAIGDYEAFSRDLYDAIWVGGQE